MSQTLRVGLVGCGWIAATYLRLIPLFRGIDIICCADLDAKRAREFAAVAGLRVRSVEQLLTADDIDLVLNLTVPTAHFDLSRRALETRKHVYSEKPYVLRRSHGKRLAELAVTYGLRIGSAPDTWLGGAHQLARSLIDAGEIGRVVSGTCFAQSAGVESWHPNPDAFYQPGGGPVYDLGPYFISNLVQLLGPVKCVTARAVTGSTHRTLGSLLRQGERIRVTTPTTSHSLLEFASGALITFCTSFDVWQHGHAPMELYGEQGTLYIPDPCFFGGELRMTRKRAFVNVLRDWPHPFSVPNQHEHCNYRGAGLAEMAQSITQARPHRCDDRFARHVVDVLSAIVASAERRTPIPMQTSCERPLPLGVDEARQLLKEPGDASQRPPAIR